MGFNVYTTGLLYGLGRIIVIAAADNQLHADGFIAETYLFSVDGGSGRYKGRWTTFPNSEDMIKIISENSDLLMEQARQVAINVIYSTQFEEWNKTSENEYISRPIELLECNKYCLIELKELHNYESKLRYIWETTKSEELKRHLKIILDMPRFEVKEIDG